MKIRSSLIRVAAPLALVGAALPFLAGSSSGATPPQFGTLSNFDVFNDTGQVTRGFEIELDGISPSNVTYEFGAPYERYGNPTVTAFSGGTLVTYASPYDSATSTWQVGTPLAPNPITPTMGHACWTGGSANYATAGCEHFGLALNATPTNVVYNWLVADPAHAGQLVHASGGGVAIAAPQWNVTPAPAAAPNQQPVVQAVLPAPVLEGDPQLGTAVWVKVYMTESTSKEDLGHLLTGDKAVPSHVETDWAILQPGAGGALAQQLNDQVQLSPKDNAIARRYEFYQYTGAYDPENHEALPVNDSSPVKGDVGNLIGNQMVALNLKAGAAGDTTAPSLTITTKSPGTTKATTLKITTKVTDPDSKSFTYYCSLDGAIPKLCTATTSLSGLAVKAHVFTVYAADQANNASRAATIRWTVKK